MPPRRPVNNLSQNMSRRPVSPVNQTFDSGMVPELAEAYANRVFDSLEPLRPEGDSNGLLKRNQSLPPRVEERLARLRGAFRQRRKMEVCQAAQELFDCMGRLGDVGLMRLSYRLLMQCRSGDLEAAQRVMNDFDGEYRRARKPVLHSEVQ